MKLLLVAFLIAAAGTAWAQQPGAYSLPGKRVFPEGIALDAKTGTFLVGSSEQGTIFAGREDSASLKAVASGDPAPPAALGIRELADGTFLVAGGRSGSAFVYDREGRRLRTYASPKADRTLINDFVVTGTQEAFATDSFRPVLFRLDPSREGALEPWLDLSKTPITYADGFNLNGIVATADGRFLIVVQTNAGKFWRVDRSTKSVDEVTVHGGGGGADGMRLVGSKLYGMRDGGISVYRLDGDARTATFLGSVRDPRFRTPTALAIDGSDALVVNSQFPARQGGDPKLPFEVVRVPLPDFARP